MANLEIAWITYCPWSQMLANAIPTDCIHLSMLASNLGLTF